MPVQPGTTSPLLVYFGTLLTRGKLNAFESVELSRLVLSQNKKHLLDNWFKARPRPCPACLGPLTQQPCICFAAWLRTAVVLAFGFSGMWCGWRKS